MDVTAARRIIREQAEAVRALLGPLLADVGHQALAIADTTLTPRGGGHPGTYCARRGD